MQSPITALETRDAETADADAIARLVNAAFRAARKFIEQDRTSPEKVRVLLESGKFLVAEDENKGAIIGCVYTEFSGERGYIGLLSVDTSRQRSGLGSRLMAAAEVRCRLEGCRFAELTFVNLRTELNRFYRRLGYEDAGTLPFPEEHGAKVPCHLVKMSKRLV